MQEESGAWRDVTIYTHATGENAVLWFGDGECEGIGDNYQYTQATGVDAKGHGAEERLVDGDGCVINIRRPSARRTGATARARDVAAPAHPRRDRKGEFLPFETALLHVRSLDLSGTAEWLAWCKSGARPANVPTNPARTYKLKGWAGYGHWLGTGHCTGHRRLSQTRNKSCSNPAPAPPR